MATVSQMLELVNDIAPFELAEAWDNVGPPGRAPGLEAWRKAMVALDLTAGALKEAVATGRAADRHPPPDPVPRPQEPAGGRRRGRAVGGADPRSRIALIAAHTNYDERARRAERRAGRRRWASKDVEPLPHGLRAGAFSGDSAALMNLGGGAGRDAAALPGRKRGAGQGRGLRRRGRGVLAEALEGGLRRLPHRRGAPPRGARGGAGGPDGGRGRALLHRAGDG